MSPSENNPSQAPETLGPEPQEPESIEPQEPEAPAATQPELATTPDEEPQETQREQEPQSKQASQSTQEIQSTPEPQEPQKSPKAPEPKSPEPEPESPESKPLKPPKSSKKLSKRVKIALFAAGWVLLLGIVAGAALIIKPAPEVVYTDAITEAYKFSQQDSAQVTDTVDDLDYYGYYTANPLVFSRVNEGSAKGVYTISGLKNKTVENKINDRIIQAASALHDTAPDQGDVYMEITANYFNLLSFYLNWYDDKAWGRKYYTFDLNTGEELRFEDLFSANVNLASLFFKSFYDKISTSIQFDKLYAERRLAAESYAPNPAQCAAQYCPLPGETYASIRALIAEYDNQMTNIEQITANAIQDYLAGEKIFYLSSSGPTLVLADDSTVSVPLKENIRYAVYLKNYRSPESLFEDGSIAATNLFFTEIPTPYYDHFNEETDTYLFSYTESKSLDYPVSPTIRQSFRDYVKNKGLSAPGDKNKFRYIYANGSVAEGGKIRIGYVSICASETDKSYYDSVYRKSIINREVQYDWMSATPTGHYDTDRVTDVPIKDNGTDYCSQQKHVAITSSGTIIEDIDGILINPPELENWRDYFKRNAYLYNCSRSWDPICYTDEEKRSHEIIYVFMGSGVTMHLKDDSEYGMSYFYHIDLNSIPVNYINPEILLE